VMVFVAVRMAWQAGRAPAEARIVRAAVAGEGPSAPGPLVRVNDRGRIAWNATAVAAVAAIGSVTGFLAGMLGVGGGFVIVPSLRAASGLSMHSVVATSLMAIALITAAAFAGALLQGAQVPWMQALPFVLGALAGMWAGRRLAPRIAGPGLQRGFAAVMLLMALGLAFRAVG
jgi:uncharacterized protein